MLAFSSALLSWLAGRFRGRVELELEVIALRHQLAVLRRQRPGRTWLSAFDRLLRVWLYRAWPQCLNVMLLVKPATVVPAENSLPTKIGTGKKSRATSCDEPAHGAACTISGCRAIQI